MLVQVDNSTSTLDGETYTRPLANALVFVDAFSQHTGRDGLVRFAVSRGNHTLTVMLSQRVWGVWRAFVLVNTTTFVRVRYYEVHTLPTMVNTTTDVGVRTSFVTLGVNASTPVPAYVAETHLRVQVTPTTVATAIRHPDVLVPTGVPAMFAVRVDTPVLLVTEATVILRYTLATVTELRER